MALTFSQYCHGRPPSFGWCSFYHERLGGDCVVRTMSPLPWVSIITSFTCIQPQSRYDDLYFRRILKSEAVHYFMLTETLFVNGKLIAIHSVNNGRSRVPSEIGALPMERVRENTPFKYWNTFTLNDHGTTRFDVHDCGERWWIDS